MTPQRVCFGWKGDRPGVHLESRTGEPVRSPKITSGTQRQCEISKCLNPEFPQEQLKNYHARKICVFQGHAKKCVERYCELANKTTQQHYKVSTPCIDDHHFKEEELKSVGELSKVCSQIVLKCLYLARIGRPILYGQ